MKNKKLPIINNVSESGIYIHISDPFLVSRASSLRATFDEMLLGKYRLATRSLSHKSNPLSTVNVAAVTFVYTKI